VRVDTKNRSSESAIRARTGAPEMTMSTIAESVNLNEAPSSVIY
jgi:hypothetical protein